MGHIINPVSVRLGKTIFWEFSWSFYQKKNYKYLLIQDLAISNFLIWFFNLKKIEKIGYILSNFKLYKNFKKISIFLYLYNKKRSFQFIDKKKKLNFSGSNSQNRNSQNSNSFYLNIVNNKNKQLKNTYLSLLPVFEEFLLLTKKNFFILFIKIKNKIFIRKLFNLNYKYKFIFINFDKQLTFLKLKLKKLMLNWAFFYFFKKKIKDLYKISILTSKFFELNFFSFFFKYVYDFINLYFIKKILNMILKHSILFNKIKFDFYFYDFVKMLNNAKFVAAYCSKTLTKEIRNKESLTSIMSPILHKLRVSGSIKGFKIMYAGRLSRAQRATYSWQKFGVVSLNTHIMPVEYGFGLFFTQYGVCSLKVWLVKSCKNYKDFYDTAVYNFKN